MDNTCSRLCLLLLVCGATAQWDYAQHGANWGAAYPACKSGAAPVLQSPIDIPSMREYFNVQDADESVEEQPHVQYENRVSTCSANAVQKGKDFAGGDLAQALLSKADITQCAPLCCKMAGCLGFTYVSVAPSDFGKCKKGQPCCFFKNVLNTPRAASECDCAAITESPTPPPPPSPPTPAPPPPTPRPASYAPVFTRAKDCTTPTRVTNGHSWEMQFNSTACTGANTVTYKNQTYALERYNFHSGSEHTLNGTRYDMEAQMVHSATVGGKKVWLVVGTLLKLDTQNSSAPYTLPTLPVHPYEAWLPSGYSRFFQFKGSMTTPPCEPSVEWILFEEAQVISATTLATFIFDIGPGRTDGIKSQAAHNCVGVDNGECTYRATQPLAARPITVGTYYP